jgi:VCBS repeat-containing protein
VVPFGGDLTLGIEQQSGCNGCALDFRVVYADTQEELFSITNDPVNSTVNATIQNVAGRTLAWSASTGALAVCFGFPCSQTQGGRWTIVMSVQASGPGGAQARIEFDGPSSFVDEPSTPLPLSVSLVMAAGDTLATSVTVDVVDATTSTATAGSDYLFVNRTLTFPAGSSHGDFIALEVGILDDLLVEGDETVQLELTNVTGPGEIGDPSHTVTIVDDELAVVSFTSAETATSEEAGLFPVVVRLTVLPPSAVLASAVDVDIADAGVGTATSGVDYGTFGTQTALFGIGSSDGDTRSVNIDVRDDSIIEGTETVVLEISAVTGPAAPTWPAQHEVTIGENEKATVAFTQPSSSVSEVVGLHAVEVVLRTVPDTATLGVLITADVFDVGGGTASSGTDYNFSTTTVSFFAGASSGAHELVLLQVLDDQVIEGDETVQLGLTDIVGPATIGAPAGHTVAIKDSENRRPVASDDNYTTTEDTTLTVPAVGGVLVNDSDVDGDPLTATLGSGPSNGTLALDSTGAFEYTPKPDFTGVDTFTYVASDGKGGSDMATVSIEIDPVNDAPVAQNGAFSTTEDVGLVGQLSASDVDGDTLTFSLVLAMPASRGTVTVQANGSFSYTPAANFFGQAVFTFKVNDGTVDSNVGSVVITVTEVNDVPTAGDDSYSATEDNALNVAAPGVLANDVDGDGEVMTATVAVGPSNGMVSLLSDGSFEYAPRADFNGSDSFTYTASDGRGGADTATVTITVAPVNDAPAAQDGVFSTAEDVGLAGALSATDVDGDTLEFRVITAMPPSQGTVTVQANGSFVFTPAANFNGQASFTFKANDGNLDSNVATAVITVTPVNDAPVAQAGSATSPEDVLLSGALSATDVDGDSLTFSLVAPMVPVSRRCRRKPERGLRLYPGGELQRADIVYVQGQRREPRLEHGDFRHQHQSSQRRTGGAGRHGLHKRGRLGVGSAAGY